MELTLSALETAHLLLDHCNPALPDDESVYEGSEQTLTQADVLIEQREQWMSGLRVSQVWMRSKGKQVVYLQATPDYASFLYCTSGMIEGYEAQHNIWFGLQANQHHIGLGSAKPIEIAFTGNSSYTLVQFDPKRYQVITGGDFKADLEDAVHIDTKMDLRRILQSLEDQTGTPRIRRLRLQTKVYELLHHFLQREEKAVVSLKTDDIDKILLAKKILEENIRVPHSLIELSRRAGINDYKLKRGFKQVVGDTVFGYLNQVRMEAAWKYLSEDKKTVGEVAFLVGYKNAQHFITAFKKRYAVLPGSLNKTR